MNLLGISWGMGARDVGMKAAVTSAQNNLDKINDGMERQSKIAGKSKVPGFWESVKQFNIGNIARDMHSLTGDTGNLSNTLESMGVANAKAAKPFVASLNLTGKEMRRMTSRISGMAIGMNVGAEAVAEVFKSMEQATGPAKEALDALGYSQKDWVKISETTGIKVAEMTDAFGGMGALWKAAPKDEAIFLNRLVEIGKKAGLGVQPVKNLKQSLEEIGNPFEKLPPEMQRTGAEMMGLVESSARLGGVFREMGSSEEEATTLGVQTAKMFGEQAVAIEQATKYGIGSLDDSPLFKYLTSLGIGMKEAINIVETGSRDSVKGMQMIQETFTKFGVGGAQQQAMLSGLSGALGEGAAGLGYLAQNADTGSKALARMGAMTVTGKDSLKNYADQAFSTGRNLQESLDLMKQSFETRFRSIARKDVVRFVGDLGRAYTEIGDKTQKLASDEMWGPLIKRLSAVNQLGAKGLFMSFGKANKQMATFSAIMDIGGGAASSLATSFGPVVSLLGNAALFLGPLVKMFGGFIGKLGLVGIAIGVVAGGLKLLSGRGIDLSGVFAKVLKTLGGLASKLRDWLANIDWAMVGKKLGGFIWDVLTWIPKTIWNWLTGKESKTELGKAGEGFIQNLGGAIIEAAKGLGKMLWNLGGEIVDSISEWWDSWTWDDVKDGFENMAGNIRTWADEMSKDPEIMQMSLDISTWFRDAGWKIQDWWYDLWDNFDSDTKRIADAMNVEGAGVQAGIDAGHGLVDGIASGIDAATSASEAVRNMTARTAQAAVDEVRNFDARKVDTEWATVAAHWTTRAVDTGKGVANTLSNALGGAIGGSFAEAGRQADGNIISMFGNMKSIVESSIVNVVMSFHKKIMEMAVGFGDLFWQLTHPKEAEQRYQQMMAKEKVARLQDIANRAQDVRDEISKQYKTNDAFMKKWKDRQASALSGAGIGVMGETDSGKMKTKKQVGAETKWKDTTWAKGAQTVADRARKALQAEQALLDMKKKVGVAGSGIGEADVFGAEQAKKQADAALKAARGDVLTKAGKAGIKGSATTGVTSAMDAIVKQEEERVKGEAALAAAQSALSNIQTQAGAAATAAGAKITEAFNQTAVGAEEAGVSVLDDFTLGLGDPNAQTVMTDVAKGTAKIASDMLTVHSPVLAGPLKDVGNMNETDPAYMAGRTLMESLAAGITSGTSMVYDAVTDALNNSVIASFDAYNVEMKKLAEKKSLLNEVAAAMVRDFGGQMSMPDTITADGKTENTKATAKAMLNVPGIAGVTLAIVTIGAKQINLLEKIRIATELSATAVQKQKDGGGKLMVLSSN
jgi:hypothetical protein